MKKELRIIKTFMVATMIVFGFTATTDAQDEHRLTLNAGAGFTPLVGRISKSLDNGWGVTAGGGYAFTSQFESKAIALLVLRIQSWRRQRYPTGTRICGRLRSIPKFGSGARGRLILTWWEASATIAAQSSLLLPQRSLSRYSIRFSGSSPRWFQQTRYSGLSRRTELVEVWVPVLM